MKINAAIETSEARSIRRYPNLYVSYLFLNEPKIAPIIGASPSADYYAPAS